MPGLKNLIFVCSGNTCRSPLAEGIARKLFPGKLLEKINVSSAGTSALEGLPASSMAIKVAERNAIDLTAHRTRLLTKSLIDQADLILTMTEQHRRTTGIVEPSALAYTHLLSEFCDEVEGDIQDPVGMGLDAYEETFSVLAKCIEGLRGKLEDYKGWKK